MQSLRDFYHSDQARSIREFNDRLKVELEGGPTAENAENKSTDTRTCPKCLSVFTVEQFKVHKCCENCE